MAEKNQEPQIPVFSVLKNNSILKNIFLIDSPPSISDFKPTENVNQENDKLLVVGRHPDCSITLEHPSISRFHLQIFSKPSKQILSVLDMSSVHGTWVSGKKIKPGERVQLNEGDTLQLGASSRVYRLHWVPLSRAYDLDDPFVPLCDQSAPVKERESETTHQDGNCLDLEINRTQLPGDETEEEPTHQDENCLGFENNQIRLPGIEREEEIHQDENFAVADNNQIQSLPNEPNKNLKSCLKKVHPLPYLNYSDYEEVEVVNKSPLTKKHEQEPLNKTQQDENCLVIDNELEGLNLWFSNPETKNQQIEVENQIPQPLVISEILSGRENLDMENQILQPPLIVSENLSGREGLESPNRSSEQNFNLLELCKLPFSDSEKEFHLSSSRKDQGLEDKSSDKREEEIHQDENFLGRENSQIQSPGDELESLDLLFSNKNLNSPLKKICPLEYLNSSYYDEEEVVNKNPSTKNHEEEALVELLPVKGGVHMHQGENLLVVDNNQIQSLDDDELEGLSLLFSDQNLKSSSDYIEDGVVNKIQSETENQQIQVVNQIPQPLVFSGILSGRENFESPSRSSEQNFNLLELFKSPYSSSRPDHEQEDKSSSIVFSESKDQNNFDDENSTPKPLLTATKSVCPIAETVEVAETQSLLIEDHEHKGILREIESDQFENENNTPYSFFGEEKEIHLSLSNKDQNDFDKENSIIEDQQKEIHEKIENDQFEKENNTPQSFTGRVSHIKDSERPLINSEQKSNLPCIWSRRGKPASVHVQTSKSRGKGKRVNIDAEVEQQNPENMENDTVSRNLFATLDGDEEENFTPDKENFTPNTLKLRIMKRKGVVEEIKHSKSYRSSPLKSVNSAGPNIHHEEQEDMFPSPKILEERKSDRPRVPFESLMANSTSQGKTKSLLLDKNTIGGENKRWIMVVDTNCLLKKNSMKALQLLQGLKRTQLIIPRIVIRELDCMKRRGCLFRRPKEVSSALQWIEECMVNTSWWIHVQSSVEEGRHLAPTPPATPLSGFTEEREGFPFISAPFSSFGSLLEIVSPTPQDHTLECALHFRRIRNDGQLVLLSDDVALKIKAMAEGLICEAAQEFRETLVNPLSERFLWADSSPRGATWSCVDDIVSREKYCGLLPLKKPSKLGEGAAKGLKLLLLHSSHYRQQHIKSTS